MTAGGHKSCLVLGGGGHAKVVIDALRAAGLAERIGVVDDDPRLAGGVVGTVPVVGGDEFLKIAAAEGFDRFIAGVGGLRDNEARQRVFRKGLEAGLTPLTVVHPSAVVSPEAPLGVGTFLAAGVIVNACAEIGDNAVINTAAVVEHDCRVGDHASVGPVATVLGGAVIAECAYVGASAVVLPAVTIGVGACVGAGAVVLRDVAAQARVAGVPARDLAAR